MGGSVGLGKATQLAPKDPDPDVRSSTPRQPNGPKAGSRGKALGRGNPDLGGLGGSPTQQEVRRRIL